MAGGTRRRLLRAARNPAPGSAGPPRLRGFVGGVFVTAGALIFDRIAFGAGERHFSGALSFAGATLGSGSGEWQGRIVFGIGAVALDAFAVGG